MEPRFQLFSLKKNQDLNFKTDIEEISDSGLIETYGFKLNGSFTGLIGALERNEADIAIQVKLI